MLDFQDKLQRAYLCEEDWWERNTLRNWYTGFRNWILAGECFLQRDGIKDFDKVIDQENFWVCFNDFLLSDEGEGQEDDMRFTEDVNVMDRRILGYKTRITAKKIQSAAIQGTQLLLDIRELEKTFGLPNTFSFAQEYLDYEQYFLFTQETATSMGLSIGACLIVILIITASV